MTSKRQKPQIPFAGTVSDSLQLMKRVWGAAGMPTPTGMMQFAAGLPGALPSMITPTLDVGELDKRIADLRAVEQWLNLNSQLLRTSIQTLEVQRNTIATLKSIGGAVIAPGGADKASAAALIQPTLPPNSFRAPGSAGPFVAAEPPAPSRQPKRSRKRAAKPVSIPPPSVAEAPFSPTAWWNTLQDQFNRIAAAAAAAEAAAEPPKAGKAGSGRKRRAARSGKAAT
jgi:hypothetical protein